MSTFHVILKYPLWNENQWNQKVLNIIINMKFYISIARYHKRPMYLYVYGLIMVMKIKIFLWLFRYIKKSDNGRFGTQLWIFVLNNMKNWPSTSQSSPTKNGNISTYDLTT